MLDSVRGLHVVLLVGLAWVVQTDDLACPFIPPNGSISNITETSLPPGIESIGLYHLSVDHISGNALDLSGTTLRKLILNDVRFQHSPRILSNITALSELHVEDTPIEDWEPDTLLQISQSVKYLVLKNVNLSAWPGWITQLHFLEKLDLSFNSLTFIPDNAFDLFADSLKELFLDGTGLVHVPHAISVLSTLEILSLSKNSFTDATEMNIITGSPLSQTLVEIRLLSSGMSQVANFSNFANLEIIEFSHNNVSIVPTGSFPPHLEGLSMSNNKLSSVPSDVAIMSRLLALVLQGNRITQISSCPFPSSLSDLYLSHNNISAISNDSFSRLTFLEALYLDDNPITTIDPGAFSDAESLQILTLYRTHLTEIPLAFASLALSVKINVSTVQPLSCPCPAYPELVEWYSKLKYTSLDSVTCSSGLPVASYLAGQCNAL